MSERGCGAQRGLTAQPRGGGQGWLPRGGGRAEWKTKVVLSGIGCYTLQFEEMVMRRWAFFWRWGHGEMRFSKPA